MGEVSDGGSRACSVSSRVGGSGFRICHSYDKAVW